MHSKRTIDSPWEFNELKRMLHEAIDRGFVDQIPPAPIAGKIFLDQEWYRDRETGEVYCLTPPDEKAGSWTSVDILFSRDLTETVQ